MLTFKKLGRYGRIGNQMFQIAGTIGIAEANGYDFAFPYWMNYDEQERFSGTDDIDIQKWFENPLPLLDGGDFNEVNVPWGFHKYFLSHCLDNSNLNGHMQSEKYFKHCEGIVRHYFKFKNETEKQVNTIAVHFRGGDYGGDYHPTMQADYYNKARELFHKSFRVLLFTDDPERAKQVINFPFELVEEPHPIKAMELMSKCDAHIIANSTFSWWGAWLANSRRVVAPSTWFGRAAKLETKDIYPEDWIVL